MLESRYSRADVALVVVAACAFSLSAPLAKAAVGLSPIAVGAGRCLVATLGILVIAGKPTLRAWRSLDARKAWSLAGAGCLLAVHFGLFLEGLAHTSLPAAVALVSLEPLAVVLAAWIAFGIRPQRREVAGVLLATLGAAWVARAAGTGENRISGDVMVLAAVAVYGAYVAAARGLRDTMPSLPYAASVYAVAFLVLLPFAVMAAAHDPLPPYKTWGFVIALGLVPTLIGHTLVQRAARHVPPALVALVSPGETVGSVAIGAFAQSAWPTKDEWVGAAFILAGATVAILGRGTRSEE